MSRSWQYIGFNPIADALLQDNVKTGTRVVVELDLEGHPTNTYTQAIFAPAYTKEQYAVEEPWMESENMLYRYTFSDGRVLEDYVQAEPWSSGPCTFMALRDAVTKEPIVETLWPQEVIDKA